MIELVRPWVLVLLPLPLLAWWLLPAHRERVRAVRLPFFQMLAQTTGQQPGEGSVLLARRGFQWLLAVPVWLALLV